LAIGLATVFYLQRRLTQEAWNQNAVSVERFTALQHAYYSIGGTNFVDPAPTKDETLGD
jgi:hypothetical protein